MSAATTGPIPDLLSVKRTSSLFCTFTAKPFKFNSTSIISSCTPSLLLYSCSTPSISTSVTAQPGIEDKRIRRNAFPRV